MVMHVTDYHDQLVGAVVPYYLHGTVNNVFNRIL